MSPRASNSISLFAYRRQARKPAIDFGDVLAVAKLPAHEVEYRFALSRRWRFDYAWPAFRIAMEIEGGTHGRLVVVDHGHERRNGNDVAIKPGTQLRLGGRHQSGTGFENDVTKYNAAALLGWLVLRATTRQVRSGYAIEILRQAFSARGLE